MKYRYSILRYLVMCVLIIVMLPVHSAYAYETTKEASEANKIFVAGSPDCYPVEYYNPKTEQFEGIIPGILEDLSENTGIEFIYLRGGEKDQRLRMVQNGQVELVSCVRASETQLINSLREQGTSLFSVEIEGENESYFMGFSEIASQELIDTVNNSLQSLTAEDMLEISIREAAEAPQNISYVYIAVLMTVLACILLIICIIIYRRYKRSAEEKSSAAENDNNRIMNLADFHDYFDDSINTLSKSLYVIAYLSFDTESMGKHYGIHSVTQHLFMSANQVLTTKNHADIVSLDETGIIIGCLSGGNDSVSAWISGILKELNSGNNSNNRLYFRAGLYRLNKDDNNCAEAIANAHQGFITAMQKNQDYAFCTDEILKKIREKKQLAAESETALKEHQIKLYLQPVVDAKTERIIGAEALTRWDHPTRGLIHPGAFISALETCGMLKEMDYYVFEQVCNQLEKWEKAGFNNYISCNFTRNTIDNSDFISQLEQRASKYKFNHSNLVIEITEEVIEANRELAHKNISLCRRAGFRIALDDLGSGVTSFGDLRDYPLDVIKIDRSILLKAEDAKGKNLLGAIIHMAQDLNILTLCEGVETKNQMALLKQLKCDYIQGYYYYRPMPVEIVDEVVRKQGKIEQKVTRWKLNRKFIKK